MSSALPRMHHRLARGHVQPRPARRSAPRDEDVGDEELVVAGEAAVALQLVVQRLHLEEPGLVGRQRRARVAVTAEWPLRRCSRPRPASTGYPSGRAGGSRPGPASTNLLTTSWSARKSAPLTVSQACSSVESPRSVRSTAAVPPSAHTEWARISWTLDTMPMSTLPSNRRDSSTAARRPARPAPRITTSCLSSRSIAEGKIGPLPVPAMAHMARVRGPLVTRLSVRALSSARPTPGCRS